MMNPHNQQSGPQGYPSPVTAYPPVPVGYPTKDGPNGYPQQTVPQQTVYRGDDFWKGCLAAICCCCFLDCCCF